MVFGVVVGVEKVIGVDEVPLLYPRQMIVTSVLVTAEVFQRRAMPDINVNLVGLFYPAGGHVDLGENVFDAGEQLVVFHRVGNGRGTVPVVPVNELTKMVDGFRRGLYVDAVVLKPLGAIELLQKVKEISPNGRSETHQHDGVIFHIVFEIVIGNGATVVAEPKLPEGLSHKAISLHVSQAGVRVPESPAQCEGIGAVAKIHCVALLVSRENSPVAFRRRFFTFSVMTFLGRDDSIVGSHYLSLHGIN